MCVARRTGVTARAQRARRRRARTDPKWFAALGAGRVLGAPPPAVAQHDGCQAARDGEQTARHGAAWGRAGTLLGGLVAAALARAGQDEIEVQRLGRR